MNELLKCKLDALIGYGGIVFVSLIATFAVFPFKMDKFTATICLSIPCITVLFLMLMFVYGTGKCISGVYYPMNKSPIWISLVLHAISFIICPILDYRWEGHKTPQQETEESTKIGLHMAFLFSSTLCSMDFFGILMDGFSETDDREKAKFEEPKISVETKNSSFNDLIIHFFGFFVVHLAVFSTFFLIFKPWMPENQIAAKVIIGSFITLTLVLGILKLALFYCYKLFGTGQLRQCNINLVIGFGGCFLSSLAPRILFFYTGLDFLNIILSQSIPLLTALTFYYLFVYGFRKTCNLDYTNHNSIISTAIIINILGLMTAIRISMCYTDKIEMEIIIISQAVFMILSTASLVDLAVVLVGGAYEKKVKSQEELEKEETFLKAIPRIECPTCKLEYSETKIPRILKECGDSVCEECADNLIRETGGKYIKCPSCRAVSLVKGMANTLAKNYAALELIQNE